MSTSTATAPASCATIGLTSISAPRAGECGKARQALQVAARAVWIDGRQESRDVLEQLDEHAAQTDGHDRTELGVIDHADQYLRAGWYLAIESG